MKKIARKRWRCEIRIERISMKKMPCLVRHECPEAFEKAENVHARSINAFGVEIGRLNGDAHKEIVLPYGRANEILTKKIPFKIVDIRPVHDNHGKAFLFGEL